MCDCGRIKQVLRMYTEGSYVRWALLGRQIRSVGGEEAAGKGEEAREVSTLDYGMD